MTKRSFVVAVCALLLACADDRGGVPTADQQPAVVAVTEPPPDSLLARGEELYFAAEYDSATAVLQRGLTGARARRDVRAEARFLMWLGIKAWKTGDFAAARAHGEQSLALKLEHGMKEELSRSYSSLGLVALQEYRLVDARSYFDTAVQTARAVNDLEGVGRAAGNLGLVSAYLGDLAGARAHLEAQLQAGGALGNDRFQANALANLAMVSIWAGDPQPAIAQLDSARVVYRKLEQPDGEPNALGQLSTAYAAMGDFRRAFAAVDSALRIARELGLRAEEEENLRLAAGLHARLGDLPHAATLYTDADALATELGFDAQRALILRRRAEVYAALNNPAAALRDVEAALRINERVGARADELDDLLLLAEIHHSSGDAARADAMLERARRLAPVLDSRIARVSVALTEARIADRARADARVLRVLRDATPDFVPGDYQTAWEEDALAARAYARLGQLDSAVARGRSAVGSIQRTRSDLTAAPLRIGYTAERADVFADLVLALLRLGRPREAFEVADAARGNELIGHLGSARRAIAGKSLAEADELLRNIDALLRQLRDIERTPPRERGAGAAGTLADVQDRLTRLRSEYEARFIRAVQGQSREAAFLGAERANETLGTAQRALAPDEAIIEYMVVPGRIITFVATRSSLEVVQSEIDATATAEQIRILRNLWSVPDGRWADALPAARALHARLIEPARRSGALHGATRLIVVPHGLLAQVPFAALSDARSARFVAQDFAVAYMPSAAAFAALRNAVEPQRFVVRRASAFAPFPQELPASGPEARAVRRRVRGTRVVTGSEATEGELRSALQQPRIVHVASHGILNANNPMFTRIELVRGAGGDEDDGRLEVHELMGLRVRSPLVFLSGCETGASSEWLNDLVRGTGETALSQAFLYAGASAVVATLWRIDDAAAAHFADTFYRVLRTQPPDRALVAAQRALIGEGRYRSPYYWGGYTLSGSLAPGPNEHRAN